MTSPLAGHAWEECLLQPARDVALERDLKRMGRGSPSYVAPYFLSCPWLARSIYGLNWDHGLLVDLGFELSDLAMLVGSQENACRFCYAVTRLQLRVMGMNEERIQELERQLSGDGLDARSVAIVRFTRRLSQSNPPPDAGEFAALEAAGLSRGQVRELIFVIAGTAFYNRLATLPAIPPESMERMPDRWFVPLVRPVIALIMRRWRWRGQSSPAAAPAEVPCASMLVLFGGSPIAEALTQVLRELWGPTSLTRRSKALMMAVIAHGLGCTALATEVGAILVEEGLSRDDIDAIVTHLAAPALAPVERSLVTFARDTIWYEARSIQRRTRALREWLKEPALIEAIGLASFANLLCRLNLALAETA